MNKSRVVGGPMAGQIAQHQGDMFDAVDDNIDFRARHVSLSAPVDVKFDVVHYRSHVIRSPGGDERRYASCEADCVLDMLDVMWEGYSKSQRPASALIRLVDLASDLDAVRDLITVAEKFPGMIEGEEWKELSYAVTRAKDRIKKRGR